MTGNEALNIEDPAALLRYLRHNGHIGATEEPEIEVLAGGVSNRTVLIQRPGGEAWVLKQALGKLRVTVDWFSSPERIHREALGMHWLSQLAPPGTITPLIFEDHTEHILAMGAVPRPHANWKTLLLAGQLSLEHIEQFARLLGSIHAQAYRRRQEIEPVFADTSFFFTLRVEPYYLYTATQIPAAAPFIHALVDAMQAQRLTLVHGDYSPKNILIHNNRLILLDHEVIHFGDPAFDLGFSLTHLLSKAHHIPALRQDFAQAARHYWSIYCQALGDVPWATELEQRAVRHTLACLLARVAGRSPLEYMNEDERLKQRRVTSALMQETPATIFALADEFVRRISRDDSH